MSDIDELSPELRALRDWSGELAVPAPPHIGAITTKGRRLLRRRRFAVAGVSVGCAAAATALTFSLIGVAGPAATSRVSTPVGRSGGNQSGLPARIQTAAFTLVSNDDGTVTLTIHPDELFEPGALESDLAQYGIAALVTPGRICSSDPSPAGLDQVESWDPGSPTVDATITIDPSAIPVGTELSFGTLDLKEGVQASYSSLIDPSAYTCTTTLPAGADHSREGVIRLDPSR